ncbi:MAG TPA: hypothetical protein VE684_00400 [Crenalkalicoccus sp.]|jgi:hypothetical protein|nr:hypothetical protein [Crenalkalicoccus sp.]
MRATVLLLALAAGGLALAPPAEARKAGRGWTRSAFSTHRNGVLFNRQTTYQRNNLTGAYTRETVATGANGRVRTHEQSGFTHGGVTAGTGTVTRPDGQTYGVTRNSVNTGGAWDRTTTVTGPNGVVSTNQVTGSLNRATGAFQSNATITRPGGVETRSVTGTALGGQFSGQSTITRPDGSVYVKPVTADKTRE